MKKLSLALCCCLLLLNGCGNSTEEKVVEQQIEKQTGGKADVDLSDKGMKITGETEGEKYSVTTGEATEIPKNFPADIPLYQPSTPVQAVEVSGGHSLSLTTPDSVEKVAESYKQQMVDKGWTEQATMNMGGQTMIVYEKNEQAAHIAIMTLEGKTHITVTVGTE